MENVDAKKSPLVSVIIPTYKRSDMLTRAVDSVLKQSYRNVQAVVVDDNDPDTEFRKKTENRMRRYTDNPKVKYICHKKNMNGAVARNTGIKNADGEIICFLDDDDWFLDRKVELQVQYLLAHPEHHAVYCGWNRDGKKVVPTKEGNLSFELLSGTNLIYTNVIMMWRKDAIACGGWDETFKRHQEAAFLLRYFKTGETIGVVSQILVEFDVSDRSNAASDSDINEQQLDHYLISYRDVIENCDIERKGAQRDIYSYRYRGALLAHIKTKNWKSSVKLYWKMTKQMPVKFNYDIFKYCLQKVKRNG